MSRTKKLQAIICFMLFFFTKNIFGQGINVSVTPSIQNIANYQTVSFNISIVPFGGFNQQVFFNVLSTNLPVGYSTTFSPSSLSFPYSIDDTLKVTLSNVSPTTDTCYIIFQAGNGPVQVQDTVYLHLVGSFCSWVFQTNTSGYSFNRLLIDNNNVKWMCWNYITPHGLLKYNGITTTYYSTSNSNLPSNLITDLALNKATNDLWMTTDAGLAKFDGTFWTVYSTSNSPLPTNNLNSVAVDTNGIVWIGAGYQSASYQGGLIRFDGTTWQLYDYSNSTIYNGNVSLVRVDRLNNIWVVSDTSYLYSNLSKYNGTTWTEYSSYGSCFRLHGSVHDIAFDSNNALWIAAGNRSGSVPNASCGLIRFDETTWEIWNRSILSPYNHRKFNLSCSTILQNNSSQFFSEDVSSIVTDNANVKWFCIDGDGSGVQTSVWNFNDSVFTKWDYTNSVFNSYGRAGMAIDSSNNIWVVYSGNKSLYESQCSDFIITAVNPPKISTSGISIFPNPAKDSFTIKIDSEIKNTLVEIFNSLGTKVYSEYLSTNIKTIDNDFKNGIYFVRLINGEKVWTAKIIKEQ